MSAESEFEFDQIARLQERCMQLELANSTQFLLISNLEKNIKEQHEMIKRLITYKIESEQKFATHSHQFKVMRSMIDVVNDRVTEVNDLTIELDRANNPGKYWGGGPR